MNKLKGVWPEHSSTGSHRFDWSSSGTFMARMRRSKSHDKWCDAVRKKCATQLEVKKCWEKALTIELGGDLAFEDRYCTSPPANKDVGDKRIRNIPARPGGFTDYSTTHSSGLIWPELPLRISITEFCSTGCLMMGFFMFTVMNFPVTSTALLHENWYFEIFPQEHWPFHFYVTYFVNIAKMLLLLWVYG